MQTTIFIFYLALKQKMLSAHMENTLNHEKSIKIDLKNLCIFCFAQFMASWKFF